MTSFIFEFSDVPFGSALEPFDPRTSTLSPTQPLSPSSPQFARFPVSPPANTNNTTNASLIEQELRAQDHAQAYRNLKIKYFRTLDRVANAERMKQVSPPDTPLQRKPHSRSMPALQQAAASSSSPFSDDLQQPTQQRRKSDPSIVRSKPIAIPVRRADVKGYDCASVLGAHDTQASLIATSLVQVMRGSPLPDSIFQFDD